MIGHYPPLSCRTSPPQGGRLQVSIFSLPLSIEVSENLKSSEAGNSAPTISPLAGEMSDRTEGGKTTIGKTGIVREG